MMNAQAPHVHRHLVIYQRNCPLAIIYLPAGGPSPPDEITDQHRQIIDQVVTALPWAEVGYYNLTLTELDIECTDDHTDRAIDLEVRIK